MLSGIADAPFSTLTGGAFATFLAIALDASPLTIGLLAAVSPAATLAPLLAAPWLDRAPRRAVAIVGLGLARVLWLAPVALVFAPHDWPRGALFLVAAALAALAGTAGGVAWLGWLGAIVPPRLRGRYFGGRAVATGLAGAVASACAGSLLDGRLAARLPGGPEVGLLVVFGLAVGFGLASVAALALMGDPGEARPAAGGGQEPAARGGGLLAGVRAATGDRRLARYLAFMLVWNVALQMGGPYITVYQLAELKVSPGTLGLLGAVTTGASLLTVRAWGRIADERGNLAVMLGAGLVAATLPGWWAAARHLPVTPFAVAMHVASGVVWGGFHLAAGNMSLALVPRERNTLPLALIGAAAGIGGAVGPVIGSVLLEALERWAGAGGGLDPYAVLFVLSSGCRLAAWGLLLGLAGPRSGRARSPDTGRGRPLLRPLLRRHAC